MTTLVLKPRNLTAQMPVTNRAPSAVLVTAFTTSSTGRVFNGRFSDRFKKS